MKIVLTIVAFILNMAVALLVMYCYDYAILWKSEDLGTRLRIPSVSDLRSADMDAISRYVAREICPAYHYDVIVNEIARLQGRDTALDGDKLAARVFLQFPLFCGARL